MCDQDTLDEGRRYEAAAALSRRRFSALTLGAALALTLPPGVRAAPVQSRRVVVPGAAGPCDAYFAAPTTGPAPAVLVWPDILGLRPAFETMARRLAEAGYAVLTVNPYYRQTPAPVVQAGDQFSMEAVRARVLPLARSLTAETTAADATAFIDFLDAQPEVDRSRPVGTTGYCMGGPMVLQTAAARPDRVGAGATFHGSRMVAEGDSSPHRLIAQSRADFLMAIAENDDARAPEDKTVLRAALAAAGRPHEVEVYAGASHGWCAIDSAVYHPELAARAFWRLLERFKGALA
jgi:carboxymethylenebutenolidase